MSYQYIDVEQKDNGNDYCVDGCCIVDVGCGFGVDVKYMQCQVKMFNYYFNWWIEIVDCYDDY